MNNLSYLINALDNCGGLKDHIKEKLMVLEKWEAGTGLCRSQLHALLKHLKDVDLVPFLKELLDQTLKQNNLLERHEVVAWEAAAQIQDMEREIGELKKKLKKALEANGAKDKA